jgi:pyruvate kinase
MLESMIKNPIPTRAEVTDISEAVWQRADGIMLSGETAGGKYPLKSVEAMVAVTAETEKDLLPQGKLRQVEDRLPAVDFCRAAAVMAQDSSEMEAIVVITKSGFMAETVASFRPRKPIFAFANTVSTQRKLQLNWGIESYQLDFSEVPEETVQAMREQFLAQHPEWTGKRFVLVSGLKIDDEFVPTIQVREF